MPQNFVRYFAYDIIINGKHAVEHSANAAETPNNDTVEIEDVALRNKLKILLYELILNYSSITQVYFPRMCYWKWQTLQ